MSNSKIRTAIGEKLFQWKNSNYPTMKIHVENKEASNTDTLYLTTQLIPSAVQNPSKGGLHERFTGVYRVILRHQNLNKGMGETEAIAENLASQFYQGLMLESRGQKVHLERSATVRPAFIDGLYVIVPVDIFYRSDVIKN